MFLKRGAGSAGGRCLRLEIDADPPHERGAGLLRFVPVEAAVGADGGRPTSRGLPPAAFFWGRGGGEMVAVPQKGLPCAGAGKARKRTARKGRPFPAPPFIRDRSKPGTLP